MTDDKVCDADGCSKVSERSINMKQIVGTSIKLKSTDLKTVHLCKDHYRELKKSTKKDRKFDSLGY